MTSVPFDFDTLGNGVVRHIPTVVSVSSVLVLGYAAATLFWHIYAGTSHLVSVSGVNTRAEQVLIAGDYSLLERATPFQSNADNSVVGLSSPAETDVIDAPETDLDLTLHGLIATGNDAGRAIISSENTAQKNYTIGDTVDNAGGAVISRIYADSVLLDRDGTVERLRLDDESALSPVNVPATESQAQTAPPSLASSVDSTDSEDPRTSDTSNQLELSSLLTREELRSLVQNIRFDPDTGSVGRGLSIFPRRTPLLFRKAGLQAGDVLVNAGGAELNEAAELPQLLEQIDNETKFEVVLIRGSQEILLTIQIDGSYSELD